MSKPDIEHYIMLKATFVDGFMDIEIDHQALSAYLGGVAYSNSLDESLTSSELQGEDLTNDGLFTSFVKAMLVRALDELVG
jgi:hypothetical protein